ncbi:MAG: hypothetical protein ACKOE4_01085 [Candidatus Kapaibacterium sp.]
MAAIWILALILITYVVTIVVIYDGQQVQTLAAAVMLAICGYSAYKLFQSRLTRL